MELAFRRLCNAVGSLSTSNNSFFSRWKEICDWDLNLKRIFKLDYNVLNLAYDETSNVLYLVAVSKSGDKYLGRVNLN